MCTCIVIKIEKDGEEELREDWLIACLQGLVKVFQHPVLYIAVLVSLLTGYLRVKRERKDFHVRIFDVSQELRYLFPQGIVWGLILSLVALGCGIVIPEASVILIAFITIVLAATTKFRLLSPAYSIGLAFLVLFFIYDQNVSVPYFHEAFSAMGQSKYPSLAVLLGLLLISEGFLIGRSAIKRPSPKRAVSKRGQTVGAYVSRRVWLIPMFVLIPGGNLPAIFDWYPVFSIGSAHIMPIVLPFLLGFSQKVRGMLPAMAIKAHGRQVVLLGVIVTLIAAGSKWYPNLSIISVVLAMLGRELISYFVKTSDAKRPFYFSPSKLGVRVLGVIPGTPADKMGLEMGEIISKVNGVTAGNELEFYAALQKNRAYCKLEVIGNNGEIRFAQKALYEGEHHELGILFTEAADSDSGKAV